MDELLGAWMQASVPPEPDAKRSAALVLDRIDEELPRRLRWFESLESKLAPSLRTAASVSSLLVLAAVVAYLLVLLPGSDSAPDRPLPAVVGATSSPRPMVAERASPQPTVQPPPIHWQSGEVDLRADSMTLRVGDEVFTGAGADFVVDAENAGFGSWSISPRWREADEDLQLRITFRSDSDRWWLSSLQLVRPNILGSDGTRYRGLVRLSEQSPAGQAFADTEPQRLGESREGDLLATGELKRPTCDQFGFEQLQISLAFEGLRISVSPHEPSILDELNDRISDAPRNLGRMLGEEKLSSTTIELECPSPETQPMTVGDLTLAVEPLGSGVLRVLGDSGANDLDRTISDVTLGEDGRVLVTSTDSLFELGSSTAPIDTREVMNKVQRVDLMPDGTPLISGGKRLGLRDTMAVLDGREWRLLPSYPRFDGLYADDLHDPSWAADGSMWVGVPKGLGRYADGVWEHVPREEFAPAAFKARTSALGATKSLAATADGEIWVGTGQTLSQLEDGVWREYAPLDPDGTVADGQLSGASRDLDIGRDGTLWSLLHGRRPGTGESGAFLVRRVDEEWAVFPLDDLAPGMMPDPQHVLVDDDGAVLLLLRSASQGPAGVRLVRFDGTTMSELARFPVGLRYRLADVGADGTVWLIGGSVSGRIADRIHIVPGPGMAAPE